MTARRMTALRETWHGTINGYSNHKCRCQPCRDAWTDYNLDLRTVRARRIAADPTLAEHGNANTYMNWGCRCEPCKAANNASNRHKRARRKAAA